MPELETVLEDDYKITKARHTAHLHLTNTIAGISLTTSWLKLAVDTTNFHVKTLGGFTFDDANDRIYWDASGAIGRSLPAIFIGDAGIQVTAGAGSGVIVTLGLFVDSDPSSGTPILETPLTFDVLNKVQGYGANELLIDAVNDDLLQSGSYFTFGVKASTGVTAQLDYFQITVKRD